METGNKNRCMTVATHVLQRKFRFRAFPERDCPQILSLKKASITLEHSRAKVQVAGHRSGYRPQVRSQVTGHTQKQ